MNQRLDPFPERNSLLQRLRAAESAWVLMHPAEGEGSFVAGRVSSRDGERYLFDGRLPGGEGRVSFSLRGSGEVDWQTADCSDAEILEAVRQMNQWQMKSIGGQDWTEVTSEVSPVFLRRFIQYVFREGLPGLALEADVVHALIDLEGLVIEPDKLLEKISPALPSNSEGSELHLEGGILCLRRGAVEITVDILGEREHESVIVMLGAARRVEGDEVGPPIQLREIIATLASVDGRGPSLVGKPSTQMLAFWDVSREGQYRFNFSGLF